MTSGGKGGREGGKRMLVFEHVKEGEGGREKGREGGREGGRE
jgi:hypothetical protein